LLLQRVLEEIPEELQRKVLEGERGPVGEAEEIQIGLELSEGVMSSLPKTVFV